MKVSMKYWKIGVYFGSIALAVGIGVFTTTVREKSAGGVPCNYRISEEVSCIEAIPNQDDDKEVCTGSFFVGYSHPDLPNTKLYITQENASACNSCSSQAGVVYEGENCGGE
jgi:hypothetical protein